MSTTSLPIQTFKRVAARLPPWTSILLRADHGVGKSKIIRQVSATIRGHLREAIKEGTVRLPEGCEVTDLAKLKAHLAETGAKFYPVIDRRLSQISEGDLLGLPSTDGETTRWNPPDWYKLACRVPCVLFLDELNRATPEVMQAAFQIVLDRELNGWKLHPLTRVYSAINSNARYSVNEIDPALLDRFYAIDLDPTLKDFCVWARDKDPDQGGNLHHSIPDFMEATKRPADGTDWLYPPKNAEAGGVHPSPRSWEFVDRALKYAEVIDDPTQEIFYHICMGFVGVEAAIMYRDYCKSIDNRITGDEVVNDYSNPRVKSKIQRLGQGKQNELVDKVSNYVVGELDKITEKQGKNISELMKDLPDELRISLWSKLTSQGIDKIDLAKSIHKHCANLVLEVFGVPMGEAGIGVIPNIPGIFKAPAKKDAK